MEEEQQARYEKTRLTEEDYYVKHCAAELLLSIHLNLELLTEYIELKNLPP